MRRQLGLNQPRAPVRVWLMVLGVAAVTALAWALAVSDLGRVTTHQPLPWPLVAAGLLGGSLMTVSFSFRNSSAGIDLSEVAIVVGIVFLAPLGLLLSVLVAQPLSSAVKGRPPAKSIFNTLSLACAAAAALAAYKVVLGAGSPASVRGWAAGAAAVMVSVAVTSTAVMVAMTVSTRRLPGHDARVALQSTVSTLPLSAALAIGAVTLLWSNRWAGLLCVALGLIAVATNRASTEFRRRYANLQRLYRFTARTAGISETHEVIPSLLREARAIMGADFVQLVLPDGNHGRYSVDAGDRVREEEPGPPSGLERLVAAARGAVLIPRGERRADLVSALAEYDLRDAVAAPVVIGSEEGVLVVGNRRGPETFDDEDQRLFEALAAHSGVAIRGGRLLERLREEASARKHEALHDGLTGLANRTMFNQALRQALGERKLGRLVSVMLMDLDGFKEINDTLGHHTGDSILREVASRLTEGVGDAGLVARLGGDEFAFVLPDLPDATSVGDLANRVLEALGRPLGVDGLMLGLRASLGISIAPEHGEERSSLLRRADVAMYHAKTNGGGMQVYDPTTDHHTTRRLILATELRRALQTDAIEVFYQPQADLATGTVVGCEALLRWNHPLHGAISPDEFIPAAEQSGIIGALTWWVLDVAIAQARTWHDRGLHLGVAVNVSARTLLDAGLVERLERLLRAAGVAPRWLTIELTESSIMSDPTRSTRVLASLRQLGVSIAIDDFGTGYSSLTRLKRLPVHVVKIDKSFVMSMTADDGDAAIVRSTIELARNLGHTVVAEGVEDQATWDRLLTLGCTRAQGFYLARPMPADAVEPWLRMRRRSHLSVVPEPESLPGS